MKNLILGTVLLTMCSFGVVVPQKAEASCSWNGYYNSGGACASSYKEKDNKHSFDNRDWYGNGWNRDYRNTNDLEYLNAYLYQLLLILAQYDITPGYSSSYGEDSTVDVRTQSATDIDEDSATLRAKVDMNDEDEAELYFAYGRSSSNLTLKTSREELDDSDDGEILDREITGLSRDTRYYFRAIAVDEDGDKDYGSILSFVTGDDSGNDDEDPVVTTRSATNIDDESAELRGTVDMNDFDNGIAFFVYGEDADQVRDVEDEYDSYDDVDEDDEYLQKVLVDSDVDGYTTLYEDVYGLDDTTDIFYSLCVEYEDSDNDSVLTCGSVREFTTD